MKAARWTSLLILPVFVLGLQAQDAKFSIKAADSAPPKELDPAIQKLLGKQSIQLSDAGGKVILGAFCTYRSGNYLAGRIMTPAYCPVTSPAGNNQGIDE